MPKFIKFDGAGAFRQYGEMYTSRTFFLIFQPSDLSRASIDAFELEYDFVHDEFT